MSEGISREFTINYLTDTEVMVKLFPVTALYKAIIKKLKTLEGGDIGEKLSS